MSGPAGEWAGPMVPADGTVPVRQGDELPLGPLTDYLKSHLPGLEGDLVVRQFPAGHSNLTYLLDFSGRQLVLRRPPPGTKAKTAHDMGREYRILKALSPFYPYCPCPRLYHEGEELIGAPFFIMDKMEGIIYRRPLPPGLTFSPEEARRLTEAVVDGLVCLHKIDVQAAGLQGLGRPEGYVERQVEGWCERFRRARTPDVPGFDAVMTWLEKNRPPDSPRISIIHNDYRLDNLVFDRSDCFSLIGVLDWEMASVGDPLMDLGATLAYWVDRDDPEELRMISLVPTTDMPGALGRIEAIRHYQQKTGLYIGNIDFYYVFGIFRLAVIAQQIYYRFYHAQTRDPRFGLLGFAVAILEKQATNIIHNGLKI